MKFNLATLDVVPNWSVHIRCAVDWRLDPGWARQLHDYDLFYVWAGRGRMTLTERTIDLRPGLGIWMRPGRRYEASHDPKEPLGVTAIHFRLKTKTRLLSLSDYVPPIEVFEPRHPDYFAAAIGHAFRLSSDPASTPVTALLLKALLLEAVADAGHSEAQGGIDLHYREAVAGALALIREHPANSPSVRELARLAGYSVDHFSRLFHQVTGQSPKEYIVRFRMQRAMALLRESSQTITQISGVLGYEDVGFFSRQFKQKLGIGPAQFRRRP